MSLDALRGFLQIGFFVGGCGLVMALLVPRDSPEFVLSLCAAALGGLLVGGVALISRWLRRQPGAEVDHED